MNNDSPGIEADGTELFGERHYTGIALAVAAALVLGSYLLQGNLSLGLSDEGFLWYGSVRTRLGEVPIRDFKAYDPGRYYWSAAWGSLFGDGILAFRQSVAFFQVFGLWLGLLAGRRAGLGWASVFPLGMVLLVWMLPYFKIFEASLVLAAVFCAAFLIGRPDPRTHFFIGCFVGLSGFIARNHGLYNFVGFLALILFLQFKVGGGGFLRKLAAWAAGVCVGYLPMLVMLVSVPGMFARFIESLLSYAEMGETNISKAIPGPWVLVRERLMQRPPLFRFQIVFYSASWVIIPLGYVGAGLLALRTRGTQVCQRQLVLAAVFLGIPHFHFAIARADIYHLLPVVSPFLLLLAGLPAAFGKEKIRAARITLFLAWLIFTVVAGASSLFWTQKVGAASDGLVATSVGEDTLLLDAELSRVVRRTQEIYRKKIGSEDSLLVIPFHPAFYSMLKIRSPVYDIYASIHQSEKNQRRMIEEMEANRVGWILYADQSVDGREDLRMNKTYPLVWEHIEKNFEKVPIDSLPEPYQFFRRRPI